MSEWKKVHLAQSKKNYIREEVIRFALEEDKILTEKQLGRLLEKSLTYHHLLWIPQEDIDDIYNDILSRYESELEARVIEEREY